MLIQSNKDEKTRDKVVAVLVFAIAIAVFYYLTQLPLAVNLKNLPPEAPKLQLEVNPTDELVIIDPEPGALLAFEGKENKTVDVHFDRARLHPDTLAELNAIGLRPPGDAGKISWVTQHGKDSHTFIDVRFTSPSSRPSTPSPQPTILQRRAYQLSTGANDHPNLQLRSDDAGFEVVMGVPLSDTDSDKLFKINDFSLRSAGAFPFRVTVADQAQFSLDFGRTQNALPFRLDKLNDDVGKVPGFTLRALGIRPKSDNRQPLPFDQWLCAAERGKLAWLRRGIGAGDCNSTDALIHLIKFELTGDKITFDLAGSAFVFKGGAFIRDNWYSRLENNKPIAALLALVYGALAKWVFGKFFKIAS